MAELGEVMSNASKKTAAGRRGAILPLRLPASTLLADVSSLL
jgi:hypothetical protein